VDALFAGLALADIAEEADVAGQVAFIVEHSGNADPGRVMLAVAALEPHFAFPGAVLVQLLEHIAQVGFLLLVDGEHVRQLVEHVRHGVATDAAERLVGLHDIAGRSVIRIADVECSNTVAAMRRSFSARRCWLISRPTPRMPSKAPCSSHTSTRRSSIGTLRPSARRQSNRYSWVWMSSRSLASASASPKARLTCSTRL